MTIPTGRGALARYLVKTLVNAHLPGAFAKEFFEAGGEVGLAWVDDDSRIRAPPEDGLAFAVPGEYASLVGIDKAGGGEIPPEG